MTMRVKTRFSRSSEVQPSGRARLATSGHILRQKHRDNAAAIHRRARLAGNSDALGGILDAELGESEHGDTENGNKTEDGCEHGDFPWRLESGL
jgi:hypothetical protein